MTDSLRTARHYAVPRQGRSKRANAGYKAPASLAMTRPLRDAANNTMDGRAAYNEQ